MSEIGLAKEKGRKGFLKPMTTSAITKPKPITNDSVLHGPNRNQFADRCLQAQLGTAHGFLFSLANCCTT